MESLWKEWLLFEQQQLHVRRVKTFYTASNIKGGQSVLWFCHHCSIYYICISKVAHHSPPATIPGSKKIIGNRNFMPSRMSIIRAYFATILIRIERQDSKWPYFHAVWLMWLFVNYIYVTYTMWQFQYRMFFLNTYISLILCVFRWVCYQLLAVGEIVCQ